LVNCQIKIMEKELKYPIKVCIHNKRHLSQKSKDDFINDFDETYNLFAFKLGKLMEDFGVAEINATISKCLLNGHPIF